MAENKQIVCISNTTWEGFYTKSTVQIMSLLARHNTVLFVEYPFTLKDMLSAMFGNKKAPVLRMLGLSKRLIRVQPRPGINVNHLIIPPTLPVEFIKVEFLYNFFLKINTSIYAWSVKKALRTLEIKNPICINAYNSIYGNNLLGKFNESLHLFYCYDGPNTGRYGEKAVTADQNFAARTDGVIVTSEFLASSLRKYNENIHVVKNGVDLETFHHYLKIEPGRNAIRKKIGYIGSLDQRFDIDMVEYSVQKLPQYDFEFTGELMNKTVEQRLSIYPNVKFRPPVKPDEVPALLQDCNAAIIPYLCNEYTKNIYPLKINEYLAVGVPVILSSFADLPEFNDIVCFARDKVSFCEYLISEIESDNKDLILKRSLFAKQNSWEKRSDLFEDIIDRLLEKR